MDTIEIIRENDIVVRTTNQMEI